MTESGGRRFAIVLGVAALVATVGGVVAFNNLQDPPRGQSVPSGTFPGPQNTGVPDGVRLKQYDGPCQITESQTVIDSQEIACDPLEIRAQGVEIRNSTLYRADVSETDASLLIEDSTIDAETFPGVALGFQNVTARRVDVQGGQTSIACSADCVIEDSWLHAQLVPGSDEHLNGFLSSGGRNVTLRRNTIACEPADNGIGGGCSGDIQIFGDMSTLEDFTIEGNLLKATPGGFCGSFGHDPHKEFGSSSSSIVVTDNVFERGDGGSCGSYGPATSFSSGNGNIWQDNVWDDGEPLPAP